VPVSVIEHLRAAGMIQAADGATWECGNRLMVQGEQEPSIAADPSGVRCEDAGWLR
jgi:hypothetical protein